MAAAIPAVALVTGGSRGIGRATARKLAARGVRVALNYRRNEAAAREALAALAGNGHALFQADVSDNGACLALIAAVLKAYGRLDVLVNNAGLYEEHDPKSVGFAEWEKSWQRTLAANLTGPAHLAYLAARQMRTQPLDSAPNGSRGRIINISSRGAFRGEPTAPAYGAAKAGLNSLGQSLARALAPEQIQVFTIAPGWVATDMANPHLDGPQAAEILAQHPLGRVATPEEVADTVAWLATDAPASLTGCIIDLNGASYLRT
jgi:NAD(P)-dependent dehydrogenase (short-subunit alcohol dehydrogenase family)